MIQKIKVILPIIFPIFIRFSYVIMKNVQYWPILCKTVFLKKEIYSVLLKLFRDEKCQIFKWINVLNISYIKIKLGGNKWTPTCLMNFVKSHCNGNALAQLQLNLWTDIMLTKSLELCSLKCYLKSCSTKLFTLWE